MYRKNEKTNTLNMIKWRSDKKETVVLVVYRFEVHENTTTIM